MKFQKTPFALAALALVSTAQAAPSNVTFKQPTASEVISGNIYQNANCEVTGTNIRRVVFSVVSSSGSVTALNTETGGPWNCNIDTRRFSDGNYTLRAVAYDAANTSTTATRAVTIRNNTTTPTTPPPSGGTSLPVVTFTKPLNGANVPTGAVSCAVNATDADGIQNVVWYLDGVAKRTETSSPYNDCQLTLTAGTHEIKAVATDRRGNKGESKITVTAGSTTTPPPTGGTGGPVVAFTKPLNGANVPTGGVSCQVTATDADGIAQVQWFQNGNLINTEKLAPYDTCLGNLTAGTHVLKAVATDTKGNKGEAQITVTAGSTGGTNTPPTVQLVAPVAGTTLNGTGTYQATATDNVAVKKVDVYLISGATSKLVDSKTAAPYAGTISTAGVPSGPATLRAIATDDAGATAQVDRSVTIQATSGGGEPTDPGTGTPGTGTTVPANGSRGVATFESIGLYWKPGNTPGADGCTVKYRKHSETAFKQGLNMWYDARNAECRGSLVHLEPNTDYAIEMASGSATAGVNVKTWSEQFKVKQTIKVQSGSATLNITQGGSEAEGYVVYEGPATLDANNAVDWNVVISAPYVIVRGLTLKNAKRDGIRLVQGAHKVVIEDNDISGWGRWDGTTTPDGWKVQVDGDSAISANCWGANAWLTHTVIQRNKLHHPRYGSNSWSDAHPKGANGVWYNDCGGHHVFRYNEIYSDWGRWFMDGIGGWENHSVKGTPNNDSDLYGNVIRHVWDDAIEAEGANNNVRIWGNYMDQTATAIASTSTVAGPLYIWRNVWNRSRARSRDKDARLYMFKSGSSSGGGGRRYVFHNTMLQAPASAGSVYPDGGGTMTQGGSQGLAAPGGGQNLTNTVSRNNTYQIYKNWWSSVDDAGGGSPANDLDNDLVNGNVTAYAGAEPNRIVGVPVYKAGHGWSSDAGGNYQLEVGSPGRDKGVRLNNFNDGYTGSAPDVGAHEADTGPMKLGVSGFGATWVTPVGGGGTTTTTTTTSTSGTTDGTGGTATTSGGLCSSASCVATQ
jgi:hypothetical protein